MNFKEYQDAAKATALYPGFQKDAGVSYCALALAGEAGEVANKVKKVLRGDVFLWDAREGIAQELGDCLWYVSELARNLGYSLDDIAQMNIAKLAARRERGTVRGEGDNR